MCDNTEQKLMEVFDMLNERLFKIESKLDILFQLKKEKCERNFEEPKLLFPSHPYDLVFKDRKPLILNNKSSYVFAEVIIKTSRSLKDTMYKENVSVFNDIIYKNIQKEDDKIFLKDVLGHFGQRITNQTNEFLIDSYHRYITDFLFEKYIQELCPSIHSVYMKDKNSYVFVFNNKFKTLDACLQELTSILEKLDVPMNEINLVYMYNVWQHHLLMMFYIHTQDEYVIDKLDEETAKIYSKYLSAVRDMRIKCDNKDILKFTSNPQKLEWFLEMLM